MMPCAIHDHTGPGPCPFCTPPPAAEPEAIAVVDMADFSGPGELLEAFYDGRIPAWAWIKTGASRHRVTPATREAITRGILLAIEARATARGA